mmetsp:Transcript_9946/g.26332  ORF Transcript_9946/g.26332 Transcript_9946/m.26332 type:complete len:103 (-) Transcript_9946:183-491(-)
MPEKVDIFTALAHQWKPLVFIVLPLAAVAYNFLPDPLEIIGCTRSKFFEKGNAQQRSWSWAAFEAAVERDRRLPDKRRPMTLPKARVLYWLFGSERVPLKTS